jgi:hypothetical protein
MTRLAALVALLVSLSACGQNTTSSPTSPGPSVFAISGTVYGNGRALAGATVTITDGIYAGQERDATDDGFYSFTNLTPFMVTLRATFPNYTPQTKTVNLTSANQSVDFAISDH